MSMKIKSKERVCTTNFKAKNHTKTANNLNFQTYRNNTYKNLAEKRKEGSVDGRSKLISCFELLLNNLLE